MNSVSAGLKILLDRRCLCAAALVVLALTPSIAPAQQSGGLELPKLPVEIPAFSSESKPPPLPVARAPEEEQDNQGDFFSRTLNMGREREKESEALSFPPLSSDDVENAVQGPAGGLSESVIKEQRRKQAFEAALQGLLPLRPEEIRELLERFDQTQESAALPVYPNPKPEVAVETLSLDPGAKPAVIKVAYGNVTTLNVLDSTGAPWPIQDISWAGNFDVIESNEQGSHIVRIAPQSEFAMGNMSMRLLTLQTPVIISLETSRESVHYRFDAIIPEYGPNAEIPLIENAVSIKAGSPEISGILQGVIPEKAKKLNVAGTDGRTSAYMMDEQTYLRTPLTLLSPSWSASAASADGMRVYAIADTPVVLLSDQGRMVRAHLSERSDQEGMIK